MKNKKLILLIAFMIAVVTLLLNTLYGYTASTADVNNSTWELSYCGYTDYKGCKWTYSGQKLNNLSLALGSGLDSYALNNKEVMVVENSSDNPMYQGAFHFNVPKSSTVGAIYLHDRHFSTSATHYYPERYSHLSVSIKVNTPLNNIDTNATLIHSSVGVYTDSSNYTGIDFIGIDTRGKIRAFGTTIGSLNDYDYVGKWLNFDVVIRGDYADCYLNGELIRKNIYTGAYSPYKAYRIAWVRPYAVRAIPDLSYSVDFADFRFATYPEENKGDCLAYHTHKESNGDCWSYSIPFEDKPFTQIYWDNTIGNYIVEYAEAKAYSKLINRETYQGSPVYSISLEDLTPLYP